MQRSGDNSGAWGGSAEELWRSNAGRGSATAMRGRRSALASLSTGNGKQGAGSASQSKAKA